MYPTTIRAVPCQGVWLDIELVIKMMVLNPVDGKAAFPQ